MGGTGQWLTVLHYSVERLDFGEEKMMIGRVTNDPSGVGDEARSQILSIGPAKRTEDLHGAVKRLQG